MREYLKSRMWSSENNQMDIVDPETGEVLSWEVTKETKGERKPPLNIALCFGRENGYRGEVSIKWDSRFARVGGESERVRGI